MQRTLSWIALEPSRISDRGIEGPPELVIEVLSESTRRRDETMKRHLYERFGVEEYWIVDPVVESVKAFRVVDEGFHKVAEINLETGGMLQTPLLAGLSIPVAEVFE